MTISVPWFKPNNNVSAISKIDLNRQIDKNHKKHFQSIIMGNSKMAVNGSMKKNFIKILILIFLEKKKKVIKF